VPVGCSVINSTGRPTHIDHDTENDEADDSTDFEDRENKFDFSVSSYSHQIDAQNDDIENRDEDGAVETIVPVTDC